MEGSTPEFFVGMKLFPSGHTDAEEAMKVVKGISRQVIVVHSPDPKLFDQAIFILKDGAVEQGVTEELLLKEAQRAVRGDTQRSNLWGSGLVWAAGGALVTGAAWLLTVLL